MKPASAVFAPMQGKIAYTVDEAMCVMNIGRTKFYQEVQAGRLKIVKLGKKTLVPATEPANWLERLTALQPA